MPVDPGSSPMDQPDTGGDLAIGDRVISTEARIRAISEVVTSVLACPVCGSPFGPPAAQKLRCLEMGHAFPVTTGIPELVVESSGEGWKAGDPAGSSEAYSKQYQALDDATRYNTMYKSRVSKRATTSREFQLIRRHIRAHEPCRTILDLPCGGGRLSRAIAGAAPDAIILEADVGLGQVRYAREHGLGEDRQFFMTASGFHIPVRDAGVDAVVCCRLLHHLPAPAEQERLIQELLRVARRFAVLTFFDYYSVKNTLRRLRAPFNRKPPKITLKPERLREIAEGHGAELVAMPYLFFLSSGHRYALLRKTG